MSTFTVRILWKQNKVEEVGPFFSPESAEETADEIWINSLHLHTFNGVEVREN